MTNGRVIPYGYALWDIKENSIQVIFDPSACWEPRRQSPGSKPPDALVVTIPDTPPCDYAYCLKIQRQGGKAWDSKSPLTQSTLLPEIKIIDVGRTELYSLGD